MPQTESSSVLRDSLRDGLLVLDDDGKFEHLRAASESLAKAYTQDRRRVLRAVHAVQDPKATESDPVFIQASEAIEAEWLTFRGRNAQGAVTLLRLTVIAALAQAVADDDELSALVWYEGVSSMTRYESHDLTDMWARIVEGAGDRRESAAQRTWALASTSVEISKIPNAKEVLAVTPKRPSDDWVTKKASAAVRPRDDDAEPVAGANPYLPNSAQQWADNFAERFGALMVEYGSSFQRLIGEANVEMAGSVQVAMNSLASSVRSATRKALKDVIEAQTHLDRRSRLLWWSRTLHSTSLDVSYRTLPLQVLPFVVALDAQALVGPFAPLSVESLIREMIAAIGCEGERVPELVEALAAGNAAVSELAPPFAVDLSGRLPLVRYLAASAVGSRPAEWDDASFERDSDPGALAVWVYRSAQAHSLAYGA